MAIRRPWARILRPIRISRGTGRLRRARQGADMNATDKARLQIEARIYRDAMGEGAESRWKLLMALVGERGFATRVVRKHLHLPTPLNTTDRIDLEQKIFPHYCSDPTIQDVLFVGCSTYTAHYQEQFFSNINFVTMDPNPALARFGSACHIEASLENLAEHCPAGAFDLIICNGVFGWGLDSYEQCE